MSTLQIPIVQGCYGSSPTNSRRPKIQFKEFGSLDMFPLDTMDATRLSIHRTCSIRSYNDTRQRQLQTYFSDTIIVISSLSIILIPLTRMAPSLLRELSIRPHHL